MCAVEMAMASRMGGENSRSWLTYAREGHVDLRRRARARAAGAVLRVALLRPSVLCLFVCSLSCVLAVARADVLARGRDAGTPILAAPRGRARTDGHADRVARRGRVDGYHEEQHIVSSAQCLAYPRVPFRSVASGYSQGTLRVL